MKYLAFLALAFTFFLCACSSKVPYTLVNTPINPEPLDSSMQVVVVKASSVPVMPLEYKYLGTVETNANLGCSAGGTIDQLREKARDLGANVVYVKKIDEKTVYASTYAGGGLLWAVVLYPLNQKCLTLLADFIYAESPLITKLQEEEKNAMASKEGKE